MPNKVSVHGKQHNPMVVPIPVRPAFVILHGVEPFLSQVLKRNPPLLLRQVFRYFLLAKVESLLRHQVGVARSLSAEPIPRKGTPRRVSPWSGEIKVRRLAINESYSEYDGSGNPTKDGAEE